MSAGSMGDPVEDLLGVDRDAILPSQHHFLAGAGLDRAAGVVLRRRGLLETAERWTDAIALTAKAIEARPLPLYALTDAAAAALQPFFSAEIRPLPPLPLAPEERQPAQWAPEAGTIQLGNGREMRDDVVHWRRLRANLDLTLVPGVPPDCQDIAAYLAKSEGAAPPKRQKLLAVVPNGVGLGHLTRLLAIVDRLRRRRDVDAQFWCYSRGAPLIEAQCHTTILRQTAEHLGADPSHWALWEAAELAHYIATQGITVVLTDMSRITPALAAALKAPGSGETGLVLVRRGMWQAWQNWDALDTAQAADLVLEPGDLAGEADRGLTASAEAAGFASYRRTAPVTLVRQTDLSPRREARRRLGIAGNTPTCLVSLGGDAMAARSPAAALIREALAGSAVRLDWLISPLAAPPLWSDPAIRPITAFPIGRDLAAYDGILTAAGYNSFHESLLLTDVPVLFLPTVERTLDDQPARAEHAAAMGWARSVSERSPAAAVQTLTAFFADVKARRRQIRALPAADGAGQMADAILPVLDRYAPIERDADAT